MPVQHETPFGPAYAQLDRKIDIIERDFRSEIANTNNKIDDLATRVLDRIDRANKPTNPYQLMGTATGIVALLGTFFGYVSANLSKDTAAVAIALNKETDERERGTRRLYEVVEADMGKVWSKDAHAEFERRIDERNALQRETDIATIARMEKAHDALVANMVPRAEHEQQWRNEQESLGQLAKQTADSIDRVTAHLNQTDLRTEASIGKLDAVIHGYGLADEVKNIEERLRNLSDKLLEVASPSSRKP